MEDIFRNAARADTIESQNKYLPSTQLRLVVGFDHFDQLSVCREIFLRVELYMRSEHLAMHCVPKIEQ